MKEFDIEGLSDAEVLQIYDEVVSGGGGDVFLIAGTLYTCEYYVYGGKYCHSEYIDNSNCPINPSFDVYYGDGVYVDPNKCTSYSGGYSNEYFLSTSCGRTVTYCKINRTIEHAK